MQKEGLIPATEFCSSHKLEVSFLYNLQQYGLLDITTIEEITYLAPDQLPQAEKMVRLSAELGINMEGIDAINHLLQRVEDMQAEIRQLKSKLSLYREDE
jgi:deoxyribodipyrimidine photolyase-like uncharacterized protein